MHNGLPGNPHFDEGNNDTGGENINIAQAIMAVAFELRTISMILSIQPVDLLDGDRLMRPKKHASDTVLDVARRMKA